MCDCDCKACQRCEEKGESKAHERMEEKREMVGKSAFGVAHDTEVSKGLISGIRGMGQAAKTAAAPLRLGNARSAVTATKAGYRRGVRNGMTKTDATLKGIGMGIRRSPGTAMGAGAAGVGAVGGTGYVAGKIND